MRRGDRPQSGGLGRSVPTGILLWLVVVGAVSTLGWLAIARAGEAASLLGSEPPARAMTASAAASAPASGAPTSAAAITPEITPAGTPAATRAATGAGHPSTAAKPPSGGAPPSTTGKTPVPAKGVPGSTTTRAGSIGASCSGSTLALSWVTPNQGWSNTRTIEDDSIEVKFVSGEDQVEVKVSCSDGRPTFEID